MISERNYILVKVSDENFTFIGDNNYYEIYSLPTNILDLKINDNLVKAGSQFEAFKKFKRTHPNLNKLAHKNFYEKELRI